MADLTGYTPPDALELLSSVELGLSNRLDRAGTSRPPRVIHRLVLHPATPFPDGSGGSRPDQTLTSQ